MRILSGLSSHKTPFKIGLLSSEETAKEVWEISCCKSPDRILQLSLKRTDGNVGNSSLGSPRSLNRERPQSSVTRCSPTAAIFTGAGGNSRAISLNFFAGTVTAPAASTSAHTSVLID